MILVPTTWVSHQALPTCMSIDLPDDLAEVPQDLLQKVLRKLPAYVRRQEPGAKLEVSRAGPDADHVRVYPGTDTYARAQRD